jgi:hypothetical protein
MLILAKITKASAGGYAEYLEGKANAPTLGDYYLRDGERTEAPGRWAAGAQEFGLDPGQRVTGEQLRALMDVRRPDTDGELRRAGGTAEAVAAIDATFSAPKSVSAVWALAAAGLREQVERAHETAVDRALTYAVRQVPMLRRRGSYIPMCWCLARCAATGGSSRSTREAGWSISASSARRIAPSWRASFGRSGSR